MALTSSSTETEAWNQYYDNVDGWRDSTTKMSAMIAAMEWLIARNRPDSMSVSGRNVVNSAMFKDLYIDVKKHVEFVAGASRRTNFVRMRPL